MNRAAYLALVEEDVKVLNGALPPESLERAHIEHILRQSVEIYYPEWLAVAIPGTSTRLEPMNDQARVVIEGALHRLLEQAVANRQPVLVAISRGMEEGITMHNDIIKALPVPDGSWDFAATGVKYGNAVDRHARSQDQGTGADQGPAPNA